MDHLGFSTATADLVQFLQFLFTIQTYFVGIHVGSRRFAATISKEMHLMQVAGNVSLNLPNSYVFQSKFRFFDIDREKPWKPGEGSSIFEERYLIPLGFIAKKLFLIVLWHRSWG